MQLSKYLSILLIVESALSYHAWVRKPLKHSSLERFALTDEWISKLNEKIESQDISIQTMGDGKSRGIISDSTIDASKHVLRVPSSLALEVTNDRPPSPFPDFVPQPLWEKSLWYQRLAFKLLHEYLVLPDSNKKPWFDELPKSFSTPFHWPVTSLDQVQYKPLVDRVRQQKEEWRVFYDDWKKQVKQLSVSYEEFVWACECVSSRAFSGVYEGSSAQGRKALLVFTIALTAIWPLFHLGTIDQALSGALVVSFSILLRDLITSKVGNLKRYVMCPVIDMFNHDSRCQSDVSYDYFGDSFSLTTQSYQSGEEVFISYGQQSNDRLLQVYGFVERDNLYDLYDFSEGIVSLLLGKLGEELAVSVPFPATPSPEQRLRTLAQALQSTDISDGKLESDKRGSQGTPGSSRSSELTVKVYRKALKQEKEEHPADRRLIKHFDDTTVRVLRGLYSSQEEWSKLWSNEKSLAVLGDPLSQSTESAVEKALHLLVTQELTSKPTSLEEDLQALESLRNGSSNSKGFSEEKKSKKRNAVSDGTLPIDLAVLEFRTEKKKLLREFISFHNS
eukprot:gene4313-4734_t